MHLILLNPVSGRFGVSCMTELSSVSKNRKTSKNAVRFFGSLLLFVVLILAACILPATAADVPTVTITEYKVSPSVLMPEGLGTITIIVKNTATSATLKENTGLYPSDAATTKVTDINVNI